MPERLAVCAARQVSPVPGTPAGAARHTKPPPTAATLHWASVVQRQKPAEQPMPLGQSPEVWQRSPLNTGSTSGQVMSQLTLEGTISLERKLPCTSATMGYSVQVHELCSCEKSTSPLAPL